MVDAYTLVFAGLLLTAGSLGDRFGRRGALQFGLVIFGLGSLASAFADSSAQLIATRAFMGIGGAFIMPATLSIITNVFPTRERGKAIGVWAGTAGLAGVLGPLTGGFLLEHFYWGSIFLVNIPIVIVGVLAGIFLIPTSKDPSAPRLDPVGAVLSIVGLTVLLYGIIEAPQDGWTDPRILGCIFGGILVLGLFMLWESRIDHPMLDVHFFRNPRFTAASMGIAMVFFAMFGATFLLTQYFQFVLGYTPFETGIRFLPIAASMMILSPLSARFVHRIGTKLVVGTGLTMVTLGLVSWASLSPTSSYWPDIIWRQALMASGMALTMAPATESIMGSLPLGKAGVGSAVNDTTRQVGGALGVAVIGSVLASIYGSQVGDFLQGQTGAERHRHRSSSSRSGSRSARASRCPGSPTPRSTGSWRACTRASWSPRASPWSARSSRSCGSRRAPATTRSPRRSPILTPSPMPRAVARLAGGRHPVTSTEAPRRLGRPRSTEADEAILVAAIELFAEVGLEGLTVEGVAARAGVGKATIYRRYPGKVDLVVAAARHFTGGTVEAPDTGSTRGDLRELIDGLVTLLTATPLGRVLPILVAARTRVAELDVAYAEIVAEKRARSSVVVRRAIARGDLRPDTDVELVVDFYVSPIFYRFLITGAPLDDVFASAIVDMTMRACLRHVAPHHPGGPRFPSRRPALRSRSVLAQWSGPHRNLRFS